MLDIGMSCHVTLLYVILYFLTLHPGILSYLVRIWLFWHVMPCHVRLCYVTLRYVILHAIVYEFTEADIHDVRLVRLLAFLHASQTYR